MILKDNLKMRLLAPKLFQEFNSVEWRGYVESLYQKPKAGKSWNFRRNEKGTPILTVYGRTPKFLLPEEYKDLKTECGMSEAELLEFLKEKKVELKE